MDINPGSAYWFLRALAFYYGKQWLQICKVYFTHQRPGLSRGCDWRSPKESEREKKKMRNVTLVTRDFTV